MNHLTSIELARLRQNELRADAAGVRLAAEAGRRRRHAFVDWRNRLTRRGRRRRTVTASATISPLARSVPFDELAAGFAADGSGPSSHELSRFVGLAAAHGATPTLLSVVADDSLPDVARQRAFGRIVVELANQGRGSARGRSDESDVA